MARSSSPAKSGCIQGTVTAATANLESGVALVAAATSTLPGERIFLISLFVDQVCDVWYVVQSLVVAIRGEGVVLSLSPLSLVLIVTTILLILELGSGVRPSHRSGGVPARFFDSRLRFRAAECLVVIDIPPSRFAIAED